jgi:DNA invertase Pin-like site-specific DNA recombinase
MARIGYARCSSEDQSLDVQIARLQAEGCQPIRSEKVSGASRDGRTELAAILDFIREGDELVVLRADRLGRDTRDVLNIVHELDQRGAYLTVLDPHVSTRGETGRIVLTALGMVAEMERRFIKERQREGIVQAKAKGAYKGGTRRVDREQVLAMHGAGAGPAAIAKTLGCSRMQVYRILGAQEGTPVAS